MLQGAALLGGLGALLGRRRRSSAGDNAGGAAGGGEGARCPPTDAVRPQFEAERRDTEHEGANEANAEAATATLDTRGRDGAEAATARRGVQGREAAEAGAEQAEPAQEPADLLRTLADAGEAVADFAGDAYSGAAAAAAGAADLMLDRGAFKTPLQRTAGMGADTVVKAPWLRKLVVQIRHDNFRAYSVACFPCRLAVKTKEVLGTIFNPFRRGWQKLLWPERYGGRIAQRLGLPSGTDVGCPPKEVVLYLAFAARLMYYLTEEGLAQGILEMAQEDEAEIETLTAGGAEMAEAAAAAPSYERGDGVARDATGGTRVRVQGGRRVNKGTQFQEFLELPAVFKDVIERVLPELEHFAVAEEIVYIHTVDSLRKEIDTNAAISINPTMKHCIVGFRGTASLQNVYTDLNILKKGADNRLGTSGPGIHEGFHDAYYRGGVAFELESRLGELYRDRADDFNRELYIVGHSLGGALSCVLAYRLIRHAILPEDVNVFVVTFGAPRVGSQRFADTFDRMPNLHMWRVVNNHDVVPRVPFTNYEHAGILMHLRDDGKSGTTTLEVTPDGFDAGCRVNSLCCNVSVYDHALAVHRSAGAEDLTLGDIMSGCVPCATADGGKDKARASAPEATPDPSSFQGYLYSINNVPPERWPPRGHPWPQSVTSRDWLVAPEGDRATPMVRTENVRFEEAEERADADTPLRRIVTAADTPNLGDWRVREGGLVRRRTLVTTVDCSAMLGADSPDEAEARALGMDAATATPVSSRQ